MKNLHIGILCHHTVGGSTKMALLLADVLALQGHHVSIFSLYKPLLYIEKGNPKLKLYSLRDKIYEHSFHQNLLLNWPEDLYNGFKSLIIDVIHKERISILHAHYAIPFSELLVDIKASLPHISLKTIVTLHGTDVSDEGLRIQYGASLCKNLNKVDQLSTVSQSHAELSKQYYQLSKPIFVISNFVAPPPLYHQKSFFIKKLPTVVHVSNFRPVKQVVLAVEILKECLSKIAIELVLIGEGPEFHAVQAYAKYHKLEHWIKFMGFCKNPSEVFMKTDLFLSTSKAESFGLAALEAMQCGLPVVVPHVGGFSELVEEGKQGFLYELPDISKAANRIALILSNRQIHQQMAWHSRIRAQDFNPMKIVEKYILLYQL